MPFDDLFDPEAKISALKIEIETLENILKDHQGFQNVVLKQRQDLSFLLKESAFFLHEFEAALTEKDFKKCTAAGYKKYEDWVKKEFELSYAAPLFVSINCPL
jgi:hypothetical protein